MPMNVHRESGASRRDHWRKVSIALVFLSAFGTSAAASAQQLYSWKDPETGQPRFSTVAPRWYRPNAPVNGPKVVVTRGSAFIDDTSLELRDRLAMAGWQAPAIAARLAELAQTPAQARR